MTLTPDTSRRLRTLGRRLASDRAERDQLIREAHAAGATLRELAAAAGMSNPGILRIVRANPKEPTT